MYFIIFICLSRDRSRFCVENHRTRVTSFLLSMKPWRRSSPVGESADTRIRIGSPSRRIYVIGRWEFRGSARWIPWETEKGARPSEDERHTLRQGGREYLCIFFFLGTYIAPSQHGRRPLADRDTFGLLGCFMDVEGFYILLRCSIDLNRLASLSWLLQFLIIRTRIRTATDLSDNVFRADVSHSPFDFAVSLRLH